MQKIYFLLSLFTTMLFISCEEVVEVDLTTAAPKLVVEASIKWAKGTTGKEQRIKLTTTTSYYSTEIPVVSGATISIKNSTNTTFRFIEVGSSGEYVCTTFVPKIDETYTLTITNDGEIYTATEVLKSVAPIEEVEQKNDGGFTSQDIQIKTYYTDPALEDNYYLYQYSYTDKITQTFYADEDSYFQGNRFFSLSQNDELAIGDEVKVVHYGISKSYYNYMNILITIAGGGSGGPFEAPPATVRGNVINNTNKDNYPLGYFSLSETDTRTYVIE